MFLLRLEQLVQGGTGISRSYVSMATHGPLGRAPERIKKHQDAYNKHYSPARLEFRLDAVTSLEGVSKADLEGVGVEFVEGLSMHDEE